MKLTSDIGIWHRIKQAESYNDNSMIYTEAMNVSGGCVIRTVNEKGGIAQTLLLNMMCVPDESDKDDFCFKLVPGVAIP